ncbi:MAG: TIGR04283 family arsenosugar biosynthesis glycosyltransferase [Leptolyngbyaceae cyanobacterium bins.349]|nr:TIGR04283 family arsenosugar biosynthesis glycosyltransferase [Leptolyngbyaceae cyanobacterium bins.349]
MTIQQPSLSVIIPVWNEASQLPATLTAIAADATVEIIVVDAGSQDDSVQIAKQFGARVLHSWPGRARQLNAGAAIAQGTLLLFLHADTQVPPDYATQVAQILSQPGVAAGAFRLYITGTQAGLRWVEWGVYWRSRVCQLPYGDQGIFLAAHTFHSLAGFPELPILEDFVLVQRLKQQGRVAIAPASVLTSGRRWQRLGVIKTTLINQLILLGYGLGVSPQRLAGWYRHLK